jgi:hypothetical protein
MHERDGDALVLRPGETTMQCRQDRVGVVALVAT